LPIRRALRALHHRNFRLYIGGQLVSLVGTWLQSVAQSWLVYRLSGSSLLLGLVGFAGQLPVFVLGPFAGAVADRVPRRSVLVVTQTSAMVLAFALGVLTIARVVTVADVFVLSALLGVVNAFDVPVRQAFVVEMVGGEDLPNAIALSSSVVNGARIVGPAIAGVLVALVGEGWCFVINGASYLAVIAALLAMRISRRVREPSGRSALGDIQDGFRFAAHEAPVRALLLLVGVVSVCAMPYVVLMPIFADRILHVGARGLGLLMGASGVGALAAALVLAMRTSVRGLGTWVAAATILLGLALVGFAGSRMLVPSIALLVAIGFCVVLEMAATNTLLQTLTPDAMRGRIMALYSMMFLGMAPFGALFAGTLASRVGAPATVAAGGVVCILAALAFGSRLPSLRERARALIAGQQAAAGEPPDDIVGARAP
jgi:MFS family permease